MSKDIIVKVQVSIISSDNTPKVLVYNDDKTIFYEEDLSEELKKLMAGKPKKFFHASLVKDLQKKGKKRLQLGKEAKWQDW